MDKKTLMQIFGVALTGAIAAFIVAGFLINWLS
jgi:hypothetical protein